MARVLPFRGRHARLHRPRVLPAAAQQRDRRLQGEPATLQHRGSTAERTRRFVCVFVYFCFCLFFSILVWLFVCVCIFLFPSVFVPLLVRSFVCALVYFSLPVRFFLTLCGYSYMSVIIRLLVCSFLCRFLCLSIFSSICSYVWFLCLFVSLCYRFLCLFVYSLILPQRDVVSDLDSLVQMTNALLSNPNTPPAIIIVDAINQVHKKLHTPKKGGGAQNIQYPNRERGGTQHIPR